MDKEEKINITHLEGIKNFALEYLKHMKINGMAESCSSDCLSHDCFIYGVTTRRKDMSAIVANFTKEVEEYCIETGGHYTIDIITYIEDLLTIFLTYNMDNKSFKVEIKIIYFSPGLLEA